MVSDGDACERGFGVGAEILVEILEMSGNGYHGGVVGGEGALRYERFDPLFAAELRDGLAHSRIGRDASADGHGGHACLPDGFA